VWITVLACAPVAGGAGKRAGVAIGDQILDLAAAADAGLLEVT
jgi:hypothetical protein